MVRVLLIYQDIEQTALMPSLLMLFLHLMQKIQNQPKHPLAIGTTQSYQVIKKSHHQLRIKQLIHISANHPK